MTEWGKRRYPLLWTTDVRGETRHCLKGKWKSVPGSAVADYDCCCSLPKKNHALVFIMLPEKLHSSDVLIKLSFVNGATFSRNSIVSNCWASLAACFQRRNWTGKQCGPFKMKWSTKWLDSLVRKNLCCHLSVAECSFQRYGVVSAWGSWKGWGLDLNNGHNNLRYGNR